MAIVVKNCSNLVVILRQETPLIVACMETMLCPCSLSRLLKCLGSRSAFADGFPNPFRLLASFFCDLIRALS